MEVTKKQYKKARRKACRPWSFLTWFSGPLAIILIAATVAVNMFDNTMALFLGGTFWKLKNEDPKAVYYESDFKSEEERVKRGYELVKQVEGEGAALLMVILPPPYVIPVFADEPEERVQISSALSALTMVTILLFAVLSVFISG